MNKDIKIRTFKKGDPSLVCSFHSELYFREYGFNHLYEKEMLEGMVDIYSDLGYNQMWIAEMDGRIVGDIAVIQRGQHSAQLRWFGVEKSLQDTGIGDELMRLAMEFCKEHDFTFIILGTIDVIKPARKLYSKFGFKLVDSEPYNEWAPDRKMHHEIWIHDAANNKSNTPGSIHAKKVNCI